MASRKRNSVKRDLDAPAPMNLKEIKELIDLLIEKGIAEFEMERSGVRIKISRNSLSRPAEVLLQAAVSRHAADAISQKPASQPPGSGAESQTFAETGQEEPFVLEGLHVVRSPMVGTFYSAPSQGDEPFVRVGDRVEVGQVLCVIEAMKLMNEIEAEVAGEVIKCYVENGQPVEYGEPLFELRPSIAASKPS